MAEVSALDLHYLIEEMKSLSGSRIDKITQPKKDEVFFQFYVQNSGKQMLRIKLPGLFCLTDEKPEIPEKLFGFCSALRKYISNAWLESVEQVGSERIAKLLFRTKDEEFIVFVELFAKGNIILCRKNMDIIIPINQTRFKGKVVKGGVKYELSEARANFFNLSLEKLKKLLKKPNQTVSKMLAVELGFGGLYSKELCFLSGVDENAQSIDSKQTIALFDSINSITCKKLNPAIVHVAGIPKPIPFELEAYNSLTKEAKKSFNSAFSAAAGATKKPATKQQKELGRLQKIVDAQESNAGHLDAEAEENQKKGEVLYEKYQLVSEVLEEIKKAREKYSWKEIKDKLKGHKLIKEVNEKTGEIIIEF